MGKSSGSMNEFFSVCGNGWAAGGTSS